MIWNRKNFYAPLVVLMFIFGVMVNGAMANEFDAYVNDFTAVNMADVATASSSSTVVDESGNTYLAYASNGDIKVQKISSGGSQLWNTTSTSVSDNTGTGLLALDNADVAAPTLSAPSIAYCGSGKIAVVAKGSATKLYMQVIDGASGNLVLPTTQTTQANRQAGIKLTTNGSTDVNTGGSNILATFYDGTGLVVIYQSATNVINVGRYSIANGGPISTPASVLDVGTANSAIQSLTATYANSKTVVAVGLAADKINSAGNTGASVYINAIDAAGTLTWPANSGCRILEGSTTGGGLGAANASDSFATLKVCSDGASGFVLVAAGSDGGTANKSIAAVRIKSGDLSGTTKDFSGNGVNILAAGTNELLDTLFIDGTSTDSVGIVYTNGTTTLFTTRSLSTAGNLGTKYTSALSLPTTSEVASAADIVSIDATHFAVMVADAAASSDINLFYITESADGLSGTKTWESELYDGANTSAPGAGLSPAITNVGGYLYTRYVKRTSTGGVSYGTNYAVKWHHTAGYDLNIQGATNLAAVSPSPFEVSANGGSVTVQDQVINRGDETSPATTVTYFLTNGTTMANATLTYNLGTRNVAALSAGNGETTIPQTALTIPAVTVHNVTGSNRYIIAVVNYTAYANEVTGQVDTANKLLDNSSTALGLTINQCNLRPRAASMTVTPTQGLTPGATITVTDTVENNGAGAAVASKTKYYLTDSSSGYVGNNLSSLGILLGERAVPALASGDISQATTTLTLPTTWTFSGTNLRIQALVDADNANNESSETDNYTADTAGTLTEEDDATSSADFLVRLPNMGGLSAGTTTRSSSMTIPSGTYKAGDTLNVVYTVANSSSDTMDRDGDGAVTGNVSGMNEDDTDNTVSNTADRNFGPMGNWATSGDIEVSFYWGANVNASGGGATPTSIADVKAQAALIKTEKLSTVINSGSNASGTTALTIPTTGGDRLYMVIDPDNKVLEGCENDNIVENQISIVQKPDLIPSGLTVSPTVAKQGDQLTAPFSVRNVGPVAATASTAGIYLSKDTTYDSGDTFVGVAPVDALAAGASITYTGTNAPKINVPSTMASGLYYLLLKANYDTTIDEATTANNTAHGAIPISVGDIAAFVASKESVSLVVKGASADVTLSGGAVPYAIKTQPDAKIATATLDGTKLTLAPVGAGSTTVVVSDNQLPGSTVTVAITVADTSHMTLSAAKATVNEKNGESKITVTNSEGEIKVSGFSDALITATVADKTITITGKAKGTTEITVTDGVTTAKIAVTITEYVAPVAPPTTTTPPAEQMPTTEEGKKTAKIYMGSGTSQTSGSTIQVTANFPPYTAPVDILVAIMPPPDYKIYAVNSSGKMVPFEAPLPMYATKQTEALTGTILPNMPVFSAFPAYDLRGTWYIAYMIFPTGDTSKYELILYTFDAKL